MSKTAITSPELAPPVGLFSQAIEVGGFARWRPCHWGPALRSTSSSRPEATHGR